MGSGVIGAALVVFAIALGVFGGISYGFYHFAFKGQEYFWPALGMFAAVIASLFVLNAALKGFFNKYSGRILFALWLIALLGSYFVFLFQEGKYPMGIDLAGGTELVYQLDFAQAERNIERAKKVVAELKASGAEENKIREARDRVDALETAKQEAPENAAEVVRRRIDPNGTKGIPVTTMGSDKTRLRIQLPKATPEEVTRIENAIQTQGRLTFHLVAGSDQFEIRQNTLSSPTKTYYDKATNIEWEVATMVEHNTITGTKKEDELVIKRLPDMEGSRVATARAQRSQKSLGWEIEVTFDGLGSAEFGKLTEKNIGRQLAVMLDGVVHTAPVIQSAIYGVCQITGNFTEQRASEVAAVLKAGSLPAEVKQESKFVVGPSLGAEQIESGMKAMFIGAGLVILFMLIYYRMNGAIAALCTLLGLLMLLGLMGFFKATLTLPGIAGIVLTLGMAVDANVLILERLREEIARGRPLRLAVSQGFDRAFITILDCNLTTLISGVVLYYLGTGPVRGFAVALSIGILTTLFCNLWLNWIVTEWLVSKDAIKSFNMMQLIGETKIDFMRMRKAWLVFTGATAVGALVLVAAFPRYDVDFTGGTLLQFNFVRGKERDANEVRTIVEDTVKKGVQARAEKTLASMKEVAASGKTGTELSRVAEEKLGKHVEVVRSAGVIEPETINKAVTSLEAALKELPRADLAAQGFGEAVSGDKYRSFTITTRLTDPVVKAELENQVLETFEKDLEPPAVTPGDKAVLVRLDTAGEINRDTFDSKLKEKLLAAAKDSANRDIKDALIALSTQNIKRQDAYQVAEIGPLPADPKQAESVVKVVKSLQIDGRAGGPISRVNGFGSQVAGEMWWQALAALIIANIAVFVYVWFRFDFSAAWGFGAIVALVHDVAIAAGGVVLAGLLGFPILINLNIVAALLTIIGFSVNDTIVTFDRIREVKHAHPTRPLAEVVNEAVNAMLGRTILTSLTVLIADLALLFFGGPTIQDMALTLLIGFIAGIYSSVFIASPLMIWWYERFGGGRAPVPGSAQESSAPAKPAGAQI
ncbi:MAG TPA: protein translocase subunit SecD [Planctomycetota bacterium]|nr:protein translocase subunit SecD [Planctomycetota bacterium]